MLPEWLEKWLKEAFHDGEKCTRHNMYKTVYCTVCMEDPICSRCSNNSLKHTDHHNQILEVRRASRRVAVKIQDIREFLDISEIQDYSINSFPVVFLNPNPNQSSIAKHKPYCHTCQRKLMMKLPAQYNFCCKRKSSELYNFCSIACKLEKEGRGMVMEKEKEKACDGPIAMRRQRHDFAAADDEQVIIEELVNTINTGDHIMIIKTDQHRTSFSYRKRCRKGPPRRAPFM